MTSHLITLTHATLVLLISVFLFGSYCIGQLSASVCMQLRTQIGVLAPRKYYLLGTNISQSPSPALHNSAFSYFSLPYEYHLFSTNSVDEIRAKLTEPDFYGASVTMPYKETCIPFMDKCSASVEKIGALNLIYKDTNGHLIGDNTDWKGIVDCIKRASNRQRSSSSSAAGRTHSPNPTKLHDRIAVVIGSGGTARAALYALSHLGYSAQSLLIYNPRTFANAQKLASHFNAVAVQDDSLPSIHKAIGRDSVHIDIIISTLPPAAAYKLPAELLLGSPLLFDVCYIPYDTPFLQSPGAETCVKVRGIDLVIAQGLHQMNVWTKGRVSSCLASIMDHAARQFYSQRTNIVFNTD